MDVPKIRIFLSSPGDVAEERRLALAVIERVQGWYRGRVELDTVSWEHEPLPADAPIQDGIPRASDCDLAVVILWSRLGSPLPTAYARPDGSMPTGTEWEFEDALRGAESERGTRVLVYRSRVSPAERIAAAHAMGRGALDDQLRQLDLVEAFFETTFQDAEDGTNARAFHVFRSPGEFEQRFQAHLVAHVEERLRGDATTRATWHGSPFRGLMAFEPEHARVFFGRSRAVNQVRQALRDQVQRGVGFVIVLGRSGSGKTSLLRAGVIPLLSDPGVVDPQVAGGSLRYAIVRPGEAGDPFEAVAAALCEETALAAGRVQPVAAILRAGPAAAAAYVSGELERMASEEGRPVRLLLIIDQLEEVFTRKGKESGQDVAFAETVAELAHTGRVWVIGAMRSDFYPALMDVQPFVALKEGGGQVDVQPPTPTEIGEMIRQPARAAGLVFDVRPDTKEGLDESLQEAAASNPLSLPLLQFTLEQLYEHREGHRLTWAAYEELGGLEGAIARRAGEVLDALPASVIQAAPRVLRALVEVGQAEASPATRRRAPLAVLVDRPDTRQFVEALIEARLLVTDRDPEGHAIVSLAHEALTRRMPMLRDLVQRDRVLLQSRARVTAAARRWQSEARDPSLLLQGGKPLLEARELLAAGIPDLEEPVETYVGASVARVRRRRWLRRGAIAAAGILIVGVVLGLRWSKANAVKEHLANAQAHASTGEFLEALASVAKAHERDPEAIAVARAKREIETARAESEESARRETARSAAAEARAQAKPLAARVGVVQAEAHRLARELAERQHEHGLEYKPTADRATLARLEKELELARAEVARTREQVRERLERAARLEAPWGGNSQATDQAFADYYEARLGDSRAERDQSQATWFRDLVLRHDAARESRLAGRGTLRIDSASPDAEAIEVFLFRYEPYESLRTEQPVVPRLVPAPTTGIRPVGWRLDLGDGDTFVPGDLGLEIVDVVADSLAAEAGLAPGDLVMRINGSACGDGLFVADVRSDRPAMNAGVVPGQRVDEIDGFPVETLRDWVLAPYVRRERVKSRGASSEPPYRVRLGTQTVEAPYAEDPGDAFGVRVATPVDLIERPAPPSGLALLCLKGGTQTLLEIPVGEVGGLKARPTAYPLVTDPADGGNRIVLGKPLTLEPGSYLLLARSPHHESQRLPFVVPRGGDVELELHLRSRGSTPPGFVYVPPGPFVSGGDPATIMGGPRKVRDGQGFMIAEAELTYGEWAEFVNDPEVRERLEDARAQGYITLYPRTRSTPGSEIGNMVDGVYVPDVPIAPVVHITRQDIDDYLMWRNERAEVAGEPWVYDLPTEWEWEQAARGADGRLFPWGDRFDWSLCVGWYRRPRALNDVAAEFEPRDVSPYGVLDLAGSVSELTRDPFASDPTKYPVKGGAWNSMATGGFRAAERLAASPNSAGPAHGFRLVARPRPSDEAATSPGAK